MQEQTPHRIGSARVWTVPNVLSMLRLAGVPLFLWLVLGPEADLAALVVLMVSGVTDYLLHIAVSSTDALRELQRIPSTSHIPVLALTANAMPREVERGLESGFARYLTKPINIDELNEAIDSTLAAVDQRRATPKAGQP